MFVSANRLVFPRVTQYLAIISLISFTTKLTNGNILML